MKSETFLKPTGCKMEEEHMSAETCQGEVHTLSAQQRDAQEMTRGE